MPTSKNHKAMYTEAQHYQRHYETLALLDKVLNRTEYKGCTIEQKADGFYVFGKRHDTKAQAVATIDGSAAALSYSIKR